MKRTILHWLPVVALGCTVTYAQAETPTRLPAELELAPGSWISVRVNEMVSSNSAREGDLFSATLTQPLIADGVVVGSALVHLAHECGDEPDVASLLAARARQLVAATAKTVAPRRLFGLRRRG